MSQSCGGAGYTLTAAENEQFYSNTFSHRVRVQTEDRAHRIGLEHHVNIIDLICSVPNAKVDVDMKVYDALVRKEINATMLTDVSKLHQLGWKHQIDLIEGIEKMVEWYKRIKN